MIGQKTQVVIENISSEELSKSISQSITDLVSKLQKSSADYGEELLSRKDTAKYLKVSIRTLHNWTRNGILNSYSIGNRVYFKKSEIDQALSKIEF